MKRGILLAGAVLLLLAGVLLGAWQISRSRTFQLFGRLVDRVETDRKVVALTFDDGPTPEGTARVLSILDSLGARATFFLTGAALLEHPEEARAILRAGHELGNHSFSHSRMIARAPRFVRREIERTDSLIRAAGHTGEIFFRAPYTKKLLVLPWVLSRTNRTTITCDVEPESHPGAWQDEQAIVAHTVRDVRPGSIVLLHVMYPSRAASMNALPAIITALRERGYEFLTVRELLGHDRDAG